MNWLRQRWMKLSPRGQLAVIPVAIVVLALCAFAVRNWAIGSTDDADAPPDVPGKIGQDLQQLHEAVTG